MKVIAFIFLVIVVQCCSQDKTAQTHKFNYPTITKQESIDTIFGKIVVDPYRNIENTEDSIVTQWYKNQASYSHSILNNNSGRDSLVNYLKDISERKSFRVSRVNITDNGKWFYLKKLQGESYYKLYYRERENDEEVLIYDPKDFKPDSGNDYSINYINPSWDGSHIVISLSHSGKELSDLIIINMSNKKPKSQILKNAWPASFLGVNWLPDNSGFTYLYFPESDSKKKNFKKNTVSVLYLLGDEPENITPILSNKLNPDLNIGTNVYPATKIKSSKDKYIVGYIASVDNFWDAYYAKISDIKQGILKWNPLYTSEEKIITSKGVFEDDEYIYLSAKNAPNRKLLSVNINDLNYNNPKIITPSKTVEVIDDFKCTQNGTFYTTSKYGVEASLYFNDNNKDRKLETPKKASCIRLSGASVTSSDIWVSLRGWINPSLRYKYDFKSKKFIEDNVSPKISYPEFENLIVEEVLVESHDGEEVPLSIIYDKSIKKNGKNPIFMYGYGAYGDIERPYFSPIMLSWVAQGGIFCTAHVRGGGEKGDTWHKSGYKSTKSNTWKDLIACTEYLIDNKFTSEDRTAIYGASAGGIMIGRAITERPDLFSVAIAEAGMMNPIRMHAEAGGGGSNYKEFGSIKDSIEAIGLYNMDSYQHINNDIDYPATYLTIGMNDPRVSPWMTGKFAARLQSASLNKRPILLLPDFNAGHSGSNDALKVYKEWANIFSFAFWQSGHPDYQ